MRLAKAGYYAGNPQAVMDTPVDVVLKILAFESFESDYEAAYYELNKGDAA